MNSDRLRYLYKQFIEDNCTDLELLEFSDLVNRSVHEPELSALMDETWEELTEEELIDIDQPRAEKIISEIVKHRVTEKQVRWMWPRVAAAIVVFISISLGIYYFNYNQTDNKFSKVQTQKVKDIQPGSNKAILTLSDGKTIVLSDASNGQINSNEGTAVHKESDGRLVYSKEKNSLQGRNLRWNTISIPRGGEYELVLADGTKVYLNSQSTLKYPEQFQGKERNVVLTGEAYFEVAKNASMPFKVNVNDKQTVQVLGTHFNISAYTDESSIKTTLVEGSVKVVKGEKQVVIKPGETAVNKTASANLNIEAADLDEVLAWRNNMFVFNDENITSIMSKISRWYDVDVSYQGNVENVNIYGNYSRRKSLSNLLKSIEVTGNVTFKIDGRRVIVLAK